MNEKIEKKTMKKNIQIPRVNARLPILMKKFPFSSFSMIPTKVASCVNPLPLVAVKNGLLFVLFGSCGFGFCGQFSTMKFHVIASSFLSPLEVVRAFFGIVSS